MSKIQTKLFKIQRGLKDKLDIDSKYIKSFINRINYSILRLQKIFSLFQH